MRTEHRLREIPKPDQAGSESVAPHGGLGGALELSINEIAVMWILHLANAPQYHQRSLTQDVIDFYPVALDTIRQADAMRGMRQADLCLIYFKGLMVARTHPRLEIINAIRHAEPVLENTFPRQDSAGMGQRPAGSLTEDSDTLAHIAVALGHPARPPH